MNVRQANLRRKCEKIWEGYKLFASAAYVSRKGFELTGLTRNTGDSAPVAETFERRGDSGLEHMAKTAWLAVAFKENFPTFFSRAASSHELFYRMLIVELCHDVGEVAIGDIPDDGNALHDTKDAAEREVFEMMTRSFDRSGVHVARLFAEFQEKDTCLGRAMYAIDKIEAVLTLIFLEQYEQYGVIDKKPFVTNADRHFMRLTHTPCATDCWAAHVKALLLDYPTEITEPIFCLLRVAVEDVRGEMFEWWDEEILPYTE